ncbi:MAG: xanthine dehydrogenase family protein molybdopterin-binding subunit [Haloarculaceae archaeon]
MAVETTDPEEVDAEDVLGTAIQRREDAALVTGEGEYADDIQRRRMVHLALLRSQYGHARIEAIDTSAAAEREGVLGVYTAADVAASGVPGELGTGGGPDVEAPRRPMLVGEDERARYQGDPVAAVVATDRYTARDAVDDIEVSYERLDTVVDTERALDDDAPRLHDDVAPDNVAFTWENGDREATEAAFAEADQVVDLELRNNRVLPTPIEPRGVVATYAPNRDRLTVELSNQNPHAVQQRMATALGISPAKVRVRTPEVGGAFGAKLQPYSGYALSAWASMQLGRPVKWQSTRTEECASAVHARDHTTRSELALDSEGNVLGLRMRTTANVGGYLTRGGWLVPTLSYGRMVTGQYDFPALHLEVTGVYTNTAPVSAYRGAGRPEAIYHIERLMDTAARERGEDPVAFRRRNFVRPDQFPYESVNGHTYDSGDYEKTLDAALEAVDDEAFRERQAAAREEGRYLGLGVSCYVEACGSAPGNVESGLVRVRPSGDVIAYTGTAENGQGHKTSFAQIVSDRLGVNYDDVEVVEGDTEEVPEGNGTAGSRSAPVGGSAISESAEKVREKARTIAAHKLEVAVDDVAFDAGAGEFHLAGAPDRAVTFREVAQAAYRGDVPDGVEPGLEATTYFDPENYTFPFGTHVAVVEVDPDTGEIDFERYVAVDDVGEQINPKIVEGQVHGGIVQGLGQALQEEAVYDDTGTLMTGSLQDYAMPRANQMPAIEQQSTVTPCPHNPLGVKGVGEAGTIAAPPALVNAVVDALSPLGVDHLDMPLSAETVWRAIEDAE